jgi:hypothetical protein
MPSEKVGSLFVEVGVHGDKAITETMALHNSLKLIAADLQRLGKNANFNAVTGKLKAVNAQATATQKNLAAVGTAASNPAQQAKLLQQQINNAHTAAIAEDKIRTQAAAKQVQQANAAAAAHAKAQQKAATQTMASLQAEGIAMNRHFDRQARMAEKAAAKQVAAAQKAAAAREKTMLREAYAMNKAFDAEAKAAEKSAAKQIAAQKLAAASRLGALKRGGADFATGGAALASANPAYALANFAQGAVKMSGAMSGASKAAFALKAGIAGVAAAAVAAEVVIAGIAAKIALFGIETAASFETLQIQLEGLLGSAAAGKEELDFLLNLGQTSIVPTESLIAASRQLAAFGVENTKQRRSLLQFISDFGTATSATEQQIYFLSLAVGQVAARGKADMVDLKQLGNAGIKTLDVYKAVGKEIGKPWQEVREGVKDGIITSDLLIKALASLDEKYAETAKKAVKSTNGLIANIKDIITVGMGRAFASLNRQVGSILLEIQDSLKTLDFTFIVRAIQNAVDNIKRALGDVPSVGDGAVIFFEETLPNAIAFVGRDIASLVKNIRILFLTVEAAGKALEGAMHATAAGVVEVALAAFDATNAMTFGLGGLLDTATLGIRNKLVDAAVEASDAGRRSFAELAVINAQIDALWKLGVNKPLTYTVSYATGAYAPGGSVYNSQLGPYVLAAMKPKPVAEDDPLNLSPKPKPTGAAKVDPRIQKMKDFLAEWKKLVDQAIKGRDALRDAFIVPFAPKIIAGGGKAITAAFKQFSSGEVDTIVSQYKTIKQALVDYYAVAEKKGGTVGKTIVAQRKADIAFLKRQTGELVRLATEAEQINKKLADAEEAYGKVTDAIDAQRAAIDKQNEAQQQSIARKYDGYYTAISKTTGKFTKGAIAIAEEALAAATTAYEAAQAKLDDLKAARDDFLSSMADMARSFVNDLSKVKEEITIFTRLDAVGSFSSVTKEIASTQSFTAGLKQRLQALRDFAANVKTLIARGVDQSLVQQILLGGPEQNGELAKALAGASSGELADINAVQADLARTIAGMQQEASAQWFDAGIAAQEAFTSPLKAAMTAAQTQVDELNRQKDLALGILQAWYDDQNAMFDAQEETAKAQYEAQKLALETALKDNQTAAEKIASAIDARIKKIPMTAYAAGLDTIQGVIDGLNSDAKLKELRAAAQRVADIIQRTIKTALRIGSPSRVMMEMGQNVGEGLAIGMGLSEPMVAGAAASLATAAVGSVDGSSAQRNTMVKVYIGDKELTDLVDLRIETADADSLNYLTTGRRF